MNNFLKILFLSPFMVLFCIITTTPVSAACGNSDLVCSYGSATIDCRASTSSALSCTYTDPSKGINQTFVSNTWKGGASNGYNFRDCITSAYGENSATDPSGSRAHTCELCKDRGDSHWSRRGAMWIKSSVASGVIEISNIDDESHRIPASLYGGYFNCGDGGDTNMKSADRILFVTESTESGSSYSGKKYDTVKSSTIIDNSVVAVSKSFEVPRGNRGSTYKWSSLASGKTIYFKNSSSIITGSPTNGIYTKTIYVWRCPKGTETKHEGDYCYSDAPSYVRLAKVALFSHNSAKASLSGSSSSVSDGGTIEISEGSATIDFAHYIKRADGWSGVSADTKYSFGDTTNPSTSLTVNPGPVTVSQSINTRDYLGKDIEEGKTETVCSDVSYINIVGINGYSRARVSGDTSKSSICARVHRSGTDSLDISGSSTVADSTNSSNSGQNITINLNPDETSRTVTFTHTISRGDSFAIDTAINHSISESIGGVINEWKVGSGWPTGTVSETLKQGSLTKTYTYNKPISVNQGEAKKVCQTLHWTPTKASFETDDSGGVVSGTVVFDSTANSTEACATVKRAELTGRSPKELSNVTINSVSDSNDWDTRVGTAQLTGANTNTDYNASFTHFLQLDEPFDEANVSYTIYEGPNKSSGTAKATGTVTLSSNDKYSLSSDVNVLTATLKVENWGETNQVCQWVEYSPTLFAFVDGVYSASSSSGTRKTNEVCASVTSPSAKEVTISANSTANASYQLPARDMSANGIFHFNHRLTNNNEGGINVDLPTTYSVYYKVTTKTRNQDWTITESAGEYAQREGKYQIDTTVGYASPTNIIDQLEYTIQGNQSVTVCEYISLNYNVFQVTDDASKTIVGKDQREPYQTSEVCQTITRPGLMRTDGDPIIITGNTNYNLTGETDKLDYSGQDGNIFNYKIGKTNNVQVNFTHTLTRNNVEKSEIINNIYYLFEDSNEIAHSAIDGSFTASQTTSINNNETISLSNGINKDFGNNNTIPMSSIGAGETKSACRNVYFKHNRYKIQYDYYYDWDGNRLEVEGTPYVTQTVDDSTDGIDNSDLVCVSVLRPYNFRIDHDGVTIKNEIEEIVQPGDEIQNIVYKINVKKRDNGDYWEKFALTGIPNAKIQLLGLTINADIDDADAPIISSIYPSSPTSNPDPCDYYKGAIGSSNLQCEALEIIEETDNYAINNGSDSGPKAKIYLTDSSITHEFSPSVTVTVPDFPVGTKYCTALAVSPINSGNGNSISEFNYGQWVVSDISCSTVSKKPTMQVLGGSVYSIGSIDTSKSTKTTATGKTYFGSWTDFAIIVRSPGEVLSGADQGMASGAKLAEGNSDSSASSPCYLSPITIANSSCSGTSTELGKSNATRDNDASKFYDYLTSKYISTASSLNYRDGNPHWICYDDHTRIYFSIGNLEIDSNINLSDGGCPGISSTGYSHLSYIPQIILLSGGKITIHDSVENIDAWIVAKDSLNTCNGYIPGDSILDYNTCNRQLKINGPVIANKVELPRTYGGNGINDDRFSDGRIDGNLSEAAEVIDYNPLTFLWGYNQATKDGQPKTVYLKKLAPRW